MDRMGIVKLNGANYPICKTKVEFLLIRDDLWKFVTGKRPEPGTAMLFTGAMATAVNAVLDPIVDAWDSGDQRARATIGLLMEDNQLSLIKGAKTAKETWEKLRGHYEQVSLLMKLCDKRYSDGEDIEQHLFEIEELLERLTVAGQELDRNLQVTMVLRSLPDSFNTLTMALETRADDDPTNIGVELELVQANLEKLFSCFF